MNYKPLAEKLRPTKLEDMIGQDHIIGKDKLLSKLLDAKQPFSVILWGPPGSGKTTLARIIATELDAVCIELSAVSAGKKDVLKVVEDASVNQRLGQRTVLFVDEIHRFNKSQQDAFLPHVESGLITLIGATTENPSFEVITPLLSRSRIIILHPLKKDQIEKLIKQALKKLGLKANIINKKAIDYLAHAAAGDARVALGSLELALQIRDGRIIDEKIAKEASQKRLPGYDKKGDMHYDIISAFIKSLRGSDANAALYYLARMLQAGEDPKFIARRMTIFASEDIGIAASPALNLAISTFLAVERIGMPECQYNLFHCAIVLAKAPKSRVATSAMSAAIKAAKHYPDLPVPLYVRNAPTNLMENLGYGKDYKWQANYRPSEGFLPPELSDLNIFSPELDETQSS